MILQWLYPPACMGCKALLALNNKRQCRIHLCEECELLLTPSEEAYPPTPFAFTRNRAAFAYEGLLRDIIRDVKFRYKRNHARALGYLWADALKKEGLGENPLLVPVPLHPAKQRERGFNQAEELAKALAKALYYPTANALRRVIDTQPQAGLHRTRRIENVTNAFDIAPKYTITGKSIILIDDIFTTGASLNECARVLRQHGAQSVESLTLTLTPKKQPQ